MFARGKRQVELTPAANRRNVPTRRQCATLIKKDATADYSDKEMRAALDVNIPNYANAIVTTNEIVGLISSA